MKQKVSIGNTAVVRGMPPKGNPYLFDGPERSGPARKAILDDFKHGRDTSAYTFWFMPCGGGAYQIMSRDEVEWGD